MPGRERSWMCFRCGYVMDAFSCVEDESATPKPGDLSMCINCGARFVRDTKQWRPMSSAEYEALEPEAKRELLRMEWARRESALPDLANKEGGRA